MAAKNELSLGTIQDVLGALDAVIARAHQQQSRIGYFASLYRRVTRKVAEGLARGRFQNGPLLERLDVIFAARYLDALATFEAGGTPARSWRVALEGCRDAGPLIIQQLLAGMNAHINLDLGIAAADTSPGSRLGELKPDFDEINALLGEQVDAVQSQLLEVSPLLGLLENIDNRSETAIINFSLRKARDAAWCSAERLVLTPRPLVGTAIDGLDLAVALMGKSVLYPSALLRLKLAPIRQAETGDVRRVIEILSSE